MSRYDLDELDACWLELVNMELKEMGEYCWLCFLSGLGVPQWAFLSKHVELKALKKKCQKPWSCLFPVPGISR